MLIYILTVG